MLHQLLESGSRPERRRGWTVASTFLHASLIASAIALTAQAPTIRAAAHPMAPLFFNPPRAISTPERLAGASRLVRPPDGALPRIRSVALPAIAGIETMAPTTSPSFSEITERPPPVTGSGAGPPPGGIHELAQVDRAVAPLGQLQPDYPSAMSAAGVEGEVLVRFVVDSSGRVEVGSITVLRTSHPQFGYSVQRWLARMHYRPGEVAGTPVRQLVEQRVGFTLRH